MDKAKLTTFRIIRIALFTAIIFVQEEIMTFLPNVQFTQCLIAIYYFSFGLLDTIAIVSIHVLLDNLFMGSLSIIYTPAMLIGWLSLVFICHALRKCKNKYIIASAVGLHGIIYSWCFVVTSVFIMKVEFVPYIIADIPFEIILVINGFLTTFLLLNPLTKVLKKLENKFVNKNEDSENKVELEELNEENSDNN